MLQVLYFLYFSFFMMYGLWLMVFAFDKSYQFFVLGLDFVLSCITALVFVLQVIGVLAQVKADKDLVDTLVQPIETADRLFQEIQALQKQVEDLEYKLDFRGQGVKTLQEIQSELNTLQSTK